MIATHEVEQAENWDLVLCLNREQISFGTPAEALSKPVLEATYGGHIVEIPGQPDLGVLPPFPPSPHGRGPPMIDWIAEPLSHGTTVRALIEITILGADQRCGRMLGRALRGLLQRRVAGPRNVPRPGRGSPPRSPAAARRGDRDHPRRSADRRDQPVRRRRGRHRDRGRRHHPLRSRSPDGALPRESPGDPVAPVRRPARGRRPPARRHGRDRDRGARHPLALPRPPAGDRVQPRRGSVARASGRARSPPCCSPWSRSPSWSASRGSATCWSPRSWSGRQPPRASSPAGSAR